MPSFVGLFLFVLTSHIIIANNNKLINNIESVISLHNWFECNSWAAPDLYYINPLLLVIVIVGYSVNAFVWLIEMGKCCSFWKKNGSLL